MLWLGYQIHKTGKVCTMGKIAQWFGNTVNHFWFCYRTCEGSHLIIMLTVTGKLLQQPKENKASIGDTENNLKSRMQHL